MTTMTHVEEAQRLLVSRVTDFRSMLDIADLESLDINSDDEEVRSDARARAIRAKAMMDEYCLDVTATEAAETILSQYGLSWERDSASFREETVTYSHVLSTGGPHDEFLVTFGDSGNGWWSVERVVYVYLPWFDRVEIDAYGGDAPANMRTPDDAETIADFYGRFFAEMVGLENEALFGGGRA